MEDDVVLRILDTNYTPDEPVGKATIPMGDLVEGDGVDDWFTVYANKEEAGRLHLKTEVLPDEQIVGSGHK